MNYMAKAFSTIGEELELRFPDMPALSRQEIQRQIEEHVADACDKYGLVRALTVLDLGAITLKRMAKSTFENLAHLEGNGFARPPSTDYI